MFKELELLAQAQKEEVERKTQGAWKCQSDKVPAWQKMISKWSSKSQGQKKQQEHKKPAVY
jgi:hypothetical protein